MLFITFSTSDLFIFYLGFEGISLPVFFLVFVYGAEITKIRASVYFIIYSLTSSTFMAISIFLLYSHFGTTDVTSLKLKFKNLSLNFGDSLTNGIIYSEVISFERLGLI